MLQNKVGEQNLFNQLGHFSFIVLFTAFFTLLHGGSFEDFKRSQVVAFEEYKEENDRVFTSYLKSEWEAYLVEESLPLYEEKKPREISPARSKVVKEQGPRFNIQVEKKQAENTTENPQNIKQEIVVTPTKVEEEQKDINIDFFGTHITLNTPQGIDKARFYPQTKEGISNYFNAVALSPYGHLIVSIKNISKDLNLNDWGKYLLIKKIGEAIFPTQDEARLFSWFIFNKLGYSVRVGLANRHIVVMHYSKKTIYMTPNYSIDDKRYYVLSDYAKGSAGRIFTYKQNYPDATKAIDLSMHSLPNFVDNPMQKVLSFTQYGKKYTIKYNYNQNLIDFMATYPQADYETFFNTPLQEESYKDIALGIKKYINQKQATVALNFVLHFVQNAFKYEVDSQQFGREKVMFAQETLYYDKSDCEDRAILFSYLIKELFHINVVGLKYKDHMATALYIPIKGDAVKVSSKKYIIADPTYMNASIGQSMPKYKRKLPESFIHLNSSKG